MSLHPAIALPAPDPQAAAGTQPHGGASLALMLHAAMLAQPRSADAAQELVISLARRMAFQRVWLAWASGPQLRLLAVSDGSLTAAAAAAPIEQHRGLLAACAEVFDQAAPVLWPEPAPEGIPPNGSGRQQVPRITRAHAALVVGAHATLSSGSAAGSAAGVPLVADGRLVGALCVQRTAGPAMGSAELQQLEHLACLAAPLLWLMKCNERSAPQRWHDALRSAWLAAGRPRQRGLRGAGGLCAMAVVAALLVPWPAQVGGRARLEGAVQRVLAAPADGFVQQVHARAGDTVRAGQPLLELADQDLQLEHQRWRSQLAQHLDALATAQARADRTQLVLHQSRADEAQAQLALTDERLQRSRLVAPFDGIVVQGDWSQQLGTPVKEGAELLTLAPRDRFRVIVEIDERDIGRLQTTISPSLGTLTLSALPWDSLPLRVTRVSPLARAVEGRNVFEVEAELLPRDGITTGGLRPGLQGTARIDAGQASPLLHLLRRSLGAARVAWWEWLG